MKNGWRPCSQALFMPKPLTITLVSVYAVINRGGDIRPVAEAKKGDVVCCWQCDQKNRLPEETGLARARCGSCHMLLAVDGMTGQLVRQFYTGDFRFR
jgi:hypothetical protein